MSKNERIEPTFNTGPAHQPGHQPPPRQEPAPAPEAPQLEPAPEATPAPAAAAPAGTDALSKAQAEIAELKDRLLRTAAESENLRKRMEREKEDALKYGAGKFAKDILTVADNLRRAIESVPVAEAEASEPVRNIVIGIEATERELLTVFERHGITRISIPTSIRRCSRCRIRASRVASSCRSSRPVTCSMVACCAPRWSACRRADRRRTSSPASRSIPRPDFSGGLLRELSRVSLAPTIRRKHPALSKNRNLASR